MDKVDLIMARFDDLKADTVEIKEHLATQNGRIRNVEVGVARQWLLWVMTGAAIVAAIPFVLEKVWIW